MAQPNAAHVASVETLEAFRSDLIVYQKKAVQAFCEIGDEVRRTRSWLEIEQRAHWERELKIRRRKLDRADQEAFSARLSQWHSGVEQKRALAVCKESVREAEQKLKLIKRWRANFDSQFDPLLKRLSALGEILESDVPAAVITLGQHIRALDAYTHTTLSTSSEEAS